MFVCVLSTGGALSQGSPLRQTSKRSTAEKWVVAERKWIGNLDGGEMIFIQSSLTRL